MFERDEIRTYISCDDVSQQLKAVSQFIKAGSLESTSEKSRRTRRSTSLSTASSCSVELADWSMIYNVQVAGWRQSADDR